MRFPAARMSIVTCRDVSNLLPLFFDGELDPRQMRAVALHGTRCGACEGELRQLERVQELVSVTIAASVDEIDLNTFWPAIERQLGPASMPWWKRVGEWWANDEHRWAVRLPAYAAAAAALALFAMLFFARTQPSATGELPQVAANDNAASIETLESDLDSVAVLNDPETRTTVLWVSEDTPVDGDVR